MLVNSLKDLANWALPTVCICCGFSDLKSSAAFCDTCQKNLPWVVDSCSKCGIKLMPNDGSLCNSCCNNPPIFNSLCGVFAYKPPISFFISQLKFHKRLALANSLADILSNVARNKWYKQQTLPEVIIPVPLHPLRQRRRGYNQAAQLAVRVAANLKLPLGGNICERIRHTKQQTKLNKTQRHDNLKNAFIINKAINFKHVAIIDDVVTTGNTVKAMSMVLTAHGVEVVDVWCVARA